MPVDLIAANTRTAISDVRDIALDFGRGLAKDQSAMVNFRFEPLLS